MKYKINYSIGGALQPIETPIQTLPPSNMIPQDTMNYVLEALTNKEIIKRCILNKRDCQKVNWRKLIGDRGINTESVINLDEPIMCKYINNEDQRSYCKFFYNYTKYEEYTKQYNDGRTPLSRAAFNGHGDVVKYLVENGADVSARDDDDGGRTPLSRAALNGHGDVVKYLVDNGADVSAGDYRGYTPLTNAAMNGHVDIVRYLVEEHGADVSASDNYGNTSLSKAALKGHNDIIRFLINAGATKSLSRKSTKNIFDKIQDETLKNEIIKLAAIKFTSIEKTST